MMVNRRTKLIVLGVAAPLMLAAGCGGSGGSGGGGGGGGGQGSDAQAFSASASGTLNAWAFDNADDVGKARLDYAKQQLSGLSITMDQTSFDAQKFTTRAVSGQVPDVVQMDRTLVGTYAAQGLIVPLDKCFSAHQVDPQQRYYPFVTSQVTYQGHVWGVPQFYQPGAIITNQRVLDKAGVSADQLDTSNNAQMVGVAKKMYKSSGGNPTTLGFDPAAIGGPETWVLSHGGRLTDDKGAPALDDPNNAQALTDLKQLIDAQGGYAKYKSFTDSFDTFGKQNPYVKDQVGAQINAQWYVNVLSPYVKSEKIGAVPLKDSQGKPFSWASGTAFVIPAKAKNPDAACAWAISLTTPQAWDAAGAARAKTLKKTPGAINTGLFTGSPEADKAIRNKYVTSSGNQGFDQTIATYYDILDQGKATYASPAGQAMKSELQNAVVAALLGKKTPQQALTDAQSASMRAYKQAGGG